MRFHLPRSVGWVPKVVVQQVLQEQVLEEQVLEPVELVAHDSPAC